MVIYFSQQSAVRVFLRTRLGRRKMYNQNTQKRMGRKTIIFAYYTTGYLAFFSRFLSHLCFGLLICKKKYIWKRKRGYFLRIKAVLLWSELRHFSLIVASYCSSAPPLICLKVKNIFRWGLYHFWGTPTPRRRAAGSPWPTSRRESPIKTCQLRITELVSVFKLLFHFV